MKNNVFYVSKWNESSLYFCIEMKSELDLLIVL